ARLACGRPCTPENLAVARDFMGFGEPWWRQLLDFLSGIVAGRTFGEGASAIHCSAPCFGYSFQQNAQVADLIASHAPVTASLAVGAALLWLVLGVGSGVLASVRRGRLADRLTMAGAVAGV